MALSCGSSNTSPPSPFDSIAPEKTLQFNGLLSRVDIVRDDYGIPHIYANYEEDAAFANGYIVAHDRMLQLELLRHVAQGRLSEMVGGLDATQIDGDLTMRMHRIGARAQAQVDALAASDDPIDKRTYLYITRFSDGVNAYIRDLRSGKWDPIDPPQQVFLNPETLEDWLPRDSISLGLFQTWSLSFDETELRLTRTREKARAAFDDSADPQRQLRTGAYVDLMPIEQLDKESTIDGWPNVASDSGTRARVAPGPRRPVIDRTAPRRSLAALDNALRLLHPVKIGGMVFGGEEDGSNNWVVGASLTGGGKTLLANDPHLSLSTPPLFHAIQITVPGALDVSGVSLAGVPAVIIGYNDKVAWGATTAYHDVLDWYEDTPFPCAAGGGNCVTRGGQEVKLETITEHFKIGTLGQIMSEFDAVYEVVPDQGPIMPVVDAATHRIVPRSAGQTVLSTHYTGHSETHELRAINRLIHSTSLADAFDALDDFEHGAQSWVITDDQGHIGYTSTAKLPRRPPSCFTYHPITAPYAQSPYFVSDGASGDCAWTGFLDPRYIPHSVDPDKGFLVTANTDPTGETFDGDPLNGPLVDGAPLYAGFDYNSGLRIGRATRRLQALKDSGTPLTIDDMASVQGDSYSSMGALLTPAILLAGDAFTTASDPAIADWKATLSAGDRTRLSAAIARLSDWSFDAPSGFEDGVTAAQTADSVAASIYNFWQVAFFVRAFGDELSLIDELPNRLYTLSTATWALTDPSKLVSGVHPDTGEAVLCDDLATAAIESCTLEVLMAMQDALEQAETQFGTADQSTWLWGKQHTLHLDPLLPLAELNIPADNDPIYPNGYPRHGDVLSVDVASNAVSLTCCKSTHTSCVVVETPVCPDLGPGEDESDRKTLYYDMRYHSGPAMRLLIERPMSEGPPIARFALPGGEILDHRGTHFRDLADNYWSKNLYFELPRSTAQIIDKAESRWVFKP